MKTLDSIEVPDSAVELTEDQLGHVSALSGVSPASGDVSGSEGHCESLVFEQCRKRLRPLRPRMITPTQENWFYKMWLEARRDEEAKNKWLAEYQCEWPESPIEGREE